MICGNQDSKLYKTEKHIEQCAVKINRSAKISMLQA